VWSIRFRRGKRYDAESREKVTKELVQKICQNKPIHPDNKNNRTEPLGMKLNSIILPIGSLSFGAAAFIYKDKANQEFENIPPIVSEAKIKAWRNYKRYQTRSDFYGWTALNLAISNLPFLSDWTNKGPKINKWALTGLFFLSSATFTTCGIISSYEADNYLKKINEDHSQLNENHVIYWGKYEEHKEKEKILYINAAINLITAIQILLFYNRDGENKEISQLYNDSQKSFSISLNFRSKYTYYPSIVFYLQKRF